MSYNERLNLADLVSQSLATLSNNINSSIPLLAGQIYQFGNELSSAFYAYSNQYAWDCFFGNTETAKTYRLFHNTEEINPFAYASPFQPISQNTIDLSILRSTDTYNHYKRSVLVLPEESEERKFSIMYANWIFVQLKLNKIHNQPIVLNDKNTVLDVIIERLNTQGKESAMDVTIYQDVYYPNGSLYPVFTTQCRWMSTRYYGHELKSKDSVDSLTGVPLLFVIETKTKYEPEDLIFGITHTVELNRFLEFVREEMDTPLEHNYSVNLDFIDVLKEKQNEAVDVYYTETVTYGGHEVIVGIMTNNQWCNIPEEEVLGRLGLWEHIDLELYKRRGSDRDIRSRETVFYFIHDRIIKRIQITDIIPIWAFSILTNMYSSDKTLYNKY